MMAGAVAGPPASPQARAWKAAEDFEAVTLDQMLQPMFATVDMSEQALGGGEAEKTWQSMFVSELGKQMERAGGIGIAKSVYAEMLRLQEHGAQTGGQAAAPINVPSSLAPGP